MLIGLSLVPIAMTGLGKPDLHDIRVLGVRQIFAASRIGVVGAGVAGVLIGSFYGLAIVFARQIGLSVSEAALFMSVVVLGGLVFQLPIGMLADRFDRRIVMAGILLTVGIAWGLLSVSIAHGVPMVVLMGMALAFGGAISSVYPLCVARTFDRLDRKFYVAASGRLLMVYSIGATLGPLLTSVLLAAFGPSAFFVFKSVIAVGYALRRNRNAALLSRLSLVFDRKRPADAAQRNDRLFLHSNIMQSCYANFIQVTMPANQRRKGGAADDGTG